MATLSQRIAYWQCNLSLTGYSLLLVFFFVLLFSPSPGNCRPSSSDMPTGVIDAFNNDVFVLLTTAPVYNKYLPPQESRTWKNKPKTQNTKQNPKQIAKPCQPLLTSISIFCFVFCLFFPLVCTGPIRVNISIFLFGFGNIDETKTVSLALGYSFSFFLHFLFAFPLTENMQKNILALYSNRILFCLALF